MGRGDFLLEDRPVNVLVLLAQDKDRYLHDYVLPPKVIQDHWKKFARNNGGVGDHAEERIEQRFSGVRRKRTPRPAICW